MRLLLTNVITRIKHIRFELKQNARVRNRLWKGRIGCYILFFVVAFASAISWGYSNPFYYFLDIVKVVMIFTIVISCGYLVVLDKASAFKWQDPTVRNVDIFAKIVLSIFEGMLFFVVSTAIYGLLFLTKIPFTAEQTYLEEFGGVSPLRYIPTPIEAFLYISCILLTLLALITSVYWVYSRGVKIVGYNDEKNCPFLDIFRIFPVVFINYPIWAMLLICFFGDVTYHSLLFPNAHPNFYFLDNSIFASQPQLFLLVQLGLLVALNFFYILDGFLANQRRKNFVDIDPHTSIDTIMNS